MHKICAGTISVLLVIILALTACANKNVPAASGQDSEASVAVSVDRVKTGMVTSTSNLSGKVKPLQEIVIIPKIPGKVASINYDTGDSVKEGDILFTLDDSDIKLQVKQAEASLSMAEAALNRINGGSAEQQVSQLKAALVSAETAYTNAKTNYERSKQLYDTGALSKQGLEAAETQLKVSEEQYKSAKTSLKVTEEKINPENLTSAAAQVEQAQAALDIAKSQLENTIVKAPITGIVAVRSIDVGELVGNTMQAMSVIDLSSVMIDISLPESLINKVSRNDKVTVSIQSAANAAVEGVITSVSPAADAKTQNYPVKIKVPNDQGIIKAGMFAEVKLNTDKAENVLTIPLAAVVDDNGRKVVYVINGDKAERREIAVGFSNDVSVQVTDGLKENETIAVKGQNLLRDGLKVTIVEE